jgi:hypothetical protein
VRLWYRRESRYVFRVPEKMMFGRTNIIGLDPFSRYSGVRPLVVVRPDRGHSAGCGRPNHGRSNVGKVLRLVVGGLWLVPVVWVLWLAAGRL